MPDKASSADAPHPARRIIPFLGDGEMSTSADDAKPTADLSEETALLADIRDAEDQIARGEGVEHDEARSQVLARLGLNNR
ncbi:MAG TPA: hypothetical protein VGX50_03370 [Longimicrobium sp.]|nr:hypothetical protein [Longimicrobium sp.]